MYSSWRMSWRSKLTRRLRPFQGKTFSLVDQMRRAAASVGMNLMEGAMRLGSREFWQFVGIAGGSAGEVFFQFILAKDLNYICEDTYRELLFGYPPAPPMI